jgi:hypothetical protein
MFYIFFCFSKSDEFIPLGYEKQKFPSKVLLHFGTRFKFSLFLPLCVPCLFIPLSIPSPTTHKTKFLALAVACVVSISSLSHNASSHHTYFSLMHSLFSMFNSRIFWNFIGYIKARLLKNKNHFIFIRNDISPHSSL